MVGENSNMKIVCIHNIKTGVFVYTVSKMYLYQKVSRHKLFTEMKMNYEWYDKILKK